jgi:hypothetical protein
MCRSVLLEVLVTSLVERFSAFLEVVAVSALVLPLLVVVALVVFVVVALVATLAVVLPVGARGLLAVEVGLAVLRSSVGLSVKVVLRFATLIESISIVVDLRFGLVWLDMFLGSSCSFLLFFLILIFVLIKIIINLLIFLILDILVEILILLILVLIFFLLGSLDLGCRFNCCFGGSHRLLFRRSSLGLSWEFSWH